MTEEATQSAESKPTGQPGQASILVLHELTRLEPLIHRAEYGTTRTGYEALTAEDFWEVGASGTCYDREFIWSALEQRATEFVEHPWDASDLRCRHLGDDTYLLTYLLRQGRRLTRRATIWQRAGQGWQIIYSQGTLVLDQ